MRKFQLGQYRTAMSFFLIFESGNPPKALDRFSISQEAGGFQIDQRLSVGSRQIIVFRDRYECLVPHRGQ